MDDATITADFVRSRIKYDPYTGKFTWLILRGRDVSALNIDAGCDGRKHGYARITFGQKGFLAHRLAWLYVTGQWPSKDIDHIDGNRSNNKWLNLREASQQQNSQNLRKARSNSKSQLLGAHYSKCNKNWAAQIRFNGKIHHIGSFSTPEDAHAAYIEKKRQVHGFCSI